MRLSPPDGTVIRYFCDGEDLLMELDGAGWPLREYTYLPGVDYYATDAAANVAGLIDGSTN